MQQNKRFVIITLAVIISVLTVTLAVQAATTISTNIVTEGTLDVTGNSTLASADIGGGYTAGSGSGSTLSAAGVFSLNSDVNVNGMATTTGSSGQFATQGFIGTGTTTPSMEISAASSATTTLLLFSSSATKGGCIQLESPSSAGSYFRMYATSSGIAFFEAGTCK